MTTDLKDTLEGLERAVLDENGRELLCPTPCNINIDNERPLTLKEQIERVTRADRLLQEQQSGIETFEESEDFDVTNEFDTAEPVSAYDYVPMEEEYLEPPPEESEVPTEATSETAPQEAAEEPPAA